mmetsp:Transcript_89681/g.252848  ORF Transcript_89681/g.252848 Transcript_89681/m.252848 type:complete len:232 (-) Transcript_89681:277-972(-)
MVLPVGLSLDAHSHAALGAERRKDVELRVDQAERRRKGRQRSSVGGRGGLGRSSFELQQVADRLQCLLNPTHVGRQLRVELLPLTEGLHLLVLLELKLLQPCALASALFTLGDQPGCEAADALAVAAIRGALVVALVLVGVGVGLAIERQEARPQLGQLRQRSRSASARGRTAAGAFVSARLQECELSVGHTPRVRLCGAAAFGGARRRPMRAAQGEELELHVPCGWSSIR